MLLSLIDLEAIDRTIVPSVGACTAHALKVKSVEKKRDGYSVGQGGRPGGLLNTTLIRNIRTLCTLKFDPNALHISEPRWWPLTSNTTSVDLEVRDPAVWRFMNLREKEAK